MINQARIGLNSRSQANPYKDGFLPLITAPMNCVADSANAEVFLKQGIRVCLPREQSFPGELDYMQTESVFSAMSLENFVDTYIDNDPVLTGKECVCIDTANGNMSLLHNTIQDAKKIYGQNLIIMGGNVSSVDAFYKLAKSGVDYIRVGIGGGSSCNTTSNVGVGVVNLAELIKECSEVRRQVSSKDKFKIVADGISSFIRFCEKEYGYNSNGYAAINKLIDAGADLVMVGTLFAQCLESAGPKRYWDSLNHQESGLKFENSPRKYINLPRWRDGYIDLNYETQVQVSGMSTLKEQATYRNKVTIDQTPSFRPSEGSVKWLPVKWTLHDWLYGNDTQDTDPYLMGYINSLKSYMSYVGKITL
jgi:hypothetical protein